MTTSLIIEEPLETADPLAEWRWKLGAETTTVALSRSGDAFVLGSDGHVWWLDTGAGALTLVADSTAAFDELLSDPQEVKRLLLAPVVEHFISLHGPFTPGRCLGYTRLPILGGSYSVENRWSAPAIEHFALTGDLHRQLRDVPDGTQVRLEHGDS